MKKQGFTGPRGFTLLEMIIVLTILSFMVIGIAVNLQNAFRARTKIQQQVHSMSQVRDALRIIEKDLNLAFHYRDLEEEIRAEIKKAKLALQPGAAQGGQPQFPGQAQFPGIQAGLFGTGAPAGAEAAQDDPAEKIRKQNRLDPVTHFIGQDDKLYFATTNTNQIDTNLVRADFIKVGYIKRSCRPPTSEKTSNCLFRLEGAIVEGDITKGGRETFLLDNVSEFSLKYLGKGKQEWGSTWSTKGEDGATKGNFPLAIEITLATETEVGGKPRKVSMQLVAGVHFANNDENQAPPGSVTQ